MQASGFRHLHPAHRIRFDEVRDLLHHAQRHFAQVLRVLEDELLHIILFVVLEVVRIQHARTDDLLDAQQLITQAADLQVQVVAARHDGFQVRSNARTLGNRALEVDVRQEDDAALEIKHFRNVFRLQRARFLVPADASFVAAVQRSLQQVQTFFLEQDAVAVIEHQDLFRRAVVVELLVQAD